MNIVSKFRIMFLIGLILLFTSMFLKWYYIQVMDGNSIVASWNYNPFIGWTQDTSKDKSIKGPKEFSIPLLINIIFLIVVVISAYSVMFKDIETQQELDKLYPYAYINFFLIVLNGYYIFCFPVFYLMPNDILYPFFYVENKIIFW